MEGIMFRLHFPQVATIAASLALGICFSPALAQTQKTSQPPTGKLAQRQRVAMELAPITVHGQHVPLLIELQTIKKGLKLPWTNDMSDTRIRCRIEHIVGSHFHMLYCESNLHHILRENWIHISLGNMLAAAAGDAPPFPGVVFKVKRNLSALLGLMHKLPPANASYTLRVTDHGKPVIDYVIKNGELVHTYHYSYKKPASGNQ